jgi:hypothetical protein
MFNANKTEYHKIETFYKRDMEKGSPTMGKLKFPLILKNRTYSAVKEWNWTEKVDGMNIRAIYTPEQAQAPLYGDCGGEAPPQSFKKFRDALWSCPRLRELVEQYRKEVCRNKR